MNGDLGTPDCVRNKADKQAVYERPAIQNFTAC